MSTIKRAISSLIVQKDLILGGRGIFGDNIQVLIISFHQVFFPGIFLQGGRICFHFIQYSLFGRNLPGVIFLAFETLIKLFFTIELGKQIILVKEEDDQ